MGANYKLVRNPDPAGTNKKKPFHARITPIDTVSIIELMEHAREFSTLSTADVKGALQLISDLLSTYLSNGYNVELDGIGYFSVSLSSRPVLEKSEIRSESVRFKNVNFRCHTHLRHRLKSMSVTRLPEEKRESFSKEEREERLWAYLKRKPIITTRTYMSVCQCSKYLALKDLNRLLARGLLIAEGYKSTRVYIKNTD